METNTTDRPETRWGHPFTTPENDLYLIGGRNQNLGAVHVILELVLYITIGLEPWMFIYFLLFCY